MKLVSIKSILIYMLIVSCNNKFKTINNPEKTPYVFTSEIELLNPQKLKQIDDFYNTESGETFTGVDSISIYYKSFLQKKDTKGAILISSGRTESAIKYKELIYDLYLNGYTIYIHDHRGQGLSGRMTNEYELGFVEHFQDYVTDMNTFYKTVIKPNNHKQVYLLAHSMGGAIGFTYLQQFPSDFTAAAFSSPMFGLNFIQCSLGKVFDTNKYTYAPTQKNFLESQQTFAENTLTNSKIRYELFKNSYLNEPKIRLGGISLHWLNESCNQFKIMFDNISKIKTSCIVFSAEEEEIVSPKSHFKFVEEAKLKNTQIEGYAVKNAKHELFIEKDKVRTDVLITILNFFDSKN